MIAFFLGVGIIICFLLIATIIVGFVKGRIYDAKFLKDIAFLSTVGAVVYTTLAVMGSGTGRRFNIIFYVVLVMAIILLLVRKNKG